MGVGHVLHDAHDLLHLAAAGAKGNEIGRIDAPLLVHQRGEFRVRGLSPARFLDLDGDAFAIMGGHDVDERQAEDV